MRIEAHILCFNESEIIRITLDHYWKMCQKITIYDNYSTDDSAQIARSNGCEVKSFGIRGKLDDEQYLSVKNHCWKGSQADYVIVCDMDEILDVGRGTLEKELEAGTTIFRTQGWDVFSNDMPVNDFAEITTGIPCEAYSKSVMFSPKLQEINFRPGAHKCDPRGVVHYNQFGKPFLFHYKNIGGVERLLARNRLYESRMTVNNRKKGYGKHYLEKEKIVRRDYENILKIAKPL